MTAGPTPDNALHASLFKPESVALVGVSGTPGKTTARPLEFLRSSGWSGRVYPVNPARKEVLGERAWPSLQDLPEVPEHVFVLTSAETAVDVVAQCAALGVKVVTILADGFLDGDEDGPALRRALRTALGTSSTRLLGPSSLGLAALADGLLLTGNAAFAEEDLPTGDVFVASQSGSAIGALLSRGKEMGIGFRSLVSTGGELDLSLGEICLASVDDPGIASYALFLENITGAEDLRAFTRAAAERGKPVVAYKLGRSEAAARLAVSHTGALAGEDVVADALIADLGIARVHNFEALLESQLLARGVPIHPGGLAAPRVCVLSTTGGGGAMVVDSLGVLGADLSGPSDETVAKLAELGIHAGGQGLIDLTLAGTRYEVMKGALDVVLSAPEFDAVVAVPGSSARYQPELTVMPIAECAGATTPLATFVVPSAPDALRQLREAGIAAFRTPEACADAVMATFARRAPGPRATRRTDSGDDFGGTLTLDEVDSYSLLGDLGVPSAKHAVVKTADLPSALPVSGPAAVKVLSAELPHKSDAGGVVLGVTDPAGLREAVHQIVSSVGAVNPDIVVDQVLVQEMVSGVGEALIGYRVDPDAGPVVVLAAGGVLAELYEDRSVRLAPVDRRTATEMVREVVAFRALDGYRGAPRGDLDALADLVVAMSQLASAEVPVLEAEANPVMILPRGQGAVAVDALVRTKDPQ